MKYLFQLVLIVIVFSVRLIAIRQCKNAIATERWAHGVIPLEGEEAVKLAKKGIILINTCSWGIVINLLVYDLLDWIGWKGLNFLE